MQDSPNCPNCGEFIGPRNDLDICPICGASLIGQDNHS